MTANEKDKLIDLITDISRRDLTLINEMKQFLQKTSFTPEELGFYFAKDETHSLCYFYKLMSLMMNSKYASFAEDKYITEVFQQWVGPGRLKETPEGILKIQAMIQNAGELYDKGIDPSKIAKDLLKELKTHLPMITQNIEKLFEDEGYPILTLDQGFGDTIVFIHVDQKTADKWRGVSFGFSKDGHEFGVRSANWERFWQHLSYTFMLPEEPVPSELRAKPFKKSVS